ncbi:MAG: TadE/TadG family type IV pilus assembly protein [Bryobacteraceae bacterium]
MRGRRGNSLLEAVFWIPIILLLMMGMFELGKLTYVYYMLQKTVTTVARYVASQQAVNFCDPIDTTVAAAKNLALTGTTDDGGTSFLQNLTADMIQVRIERFDVAVGELQECECSSTGCDATSSGRSPDFIVVSIPDGYNFTPRIPFVPLVEIALRPSVRVAFGGT